MNRALYAPFCLLWILMYAQAAEIVVVYPRSSDTAHPHIYAATLDSTFVLGRVAPPVGQLTINGISVSYDSSGAFLAWLPLRHGSAERSWDVVLGRDGQTLASIRVPYELAADTARSNAPSTTNPTGYPQVVRVTVQNAHLRTALQGTYQVFPDSGCRMLAVGRDGEFVKVRVCEGLEDWIESDAVAFDSGSALTPPLLGNGACRREPNRSVCAFALPRSVLWTSSVTSDGRTLRVTLFDVLSGVNRIRYDVTDSFIREVTWEQVPGRLNLEIRCNAVIGQGYAVNFSRDSLRIAIRAPLSRTKRSLRGKVVVVDPGHGGMSAGAIGALGTEEKSVTLAWARILSAELRRQGAVVKLTRASDVDIPLYDRVELARRADADFFLSLHCNAVPDSENPLSRHGTGTYYYQTDARPAAEMIHARLLRADNLRDDGLYEANLAVVRPTEFPAVLIEAAYIIYPPEERLLQSDRFLRTLAQAVVRGLNDYYQRVP